MVRQNALEIRCSQMFLGLNVERPSRGCAPFFFINDHVNSITRNSLILQYNFSLELH